MIAILVTAGCFYLAAALVALGIQDRVVQKYVINDS